MKTIESSVPDTTKQLPIFQYLATFTGVLNIICSGMFYGWASPSLPKLLQSDSYLPITDDEGLWIAAMFFIGGVCGDISGAALVDKLGRRNVTLLTSLPFFVSWMMVAYVQSVELLYLARFLAGISDGMIFSSICLYLSEISDPKIRGFSGSIITVAHTFGMLLINVIGSYFSISTAALVSSIVPILTLLTFSWMPQSPYYLIMKGDLEQARRSLKIFKASEDVEEELNRLSQATKEQTLNTGKYLDLFTVKSNRRAVFIATGLQTAQHCTGAVVIGIYVQTIFEEVGDISPSEAAIVYFSMQTITSIFPALIVDKIGRRPLMIISLTGLTLCLLTEGCYFFVKNTTDIDTDSVIWVSITVFIVFAVMYSIGIQTVPFLIIGEIFPTNVKAFGLCYVGLLCSGSATAVSKFFQFTKDEFGLHVPFFVFTVCTFLGLLFIIFFVPETKGKTLEKIQEELKDVKNVDKIMDPVTINNV